MTVARRSAADFVPHRPPMLCVDEVGEEGTDSLVCYATIRADHIFLDGDVVHPLALIEIVAQACAVFAGLRGQREGKPPRLGMLVGCREAEFLVDRLDVGDELTITVHRVYGQTEVAAFAGQVERRGALIGRVALSVVDGDAALHGAGREGEA